MKRLLVYAVAQLDLPPLEMPPRFKHDVNYFMTPADEAGLAPLPKGEYWIRLADARHWLDELVIPIVSPLDSASRAEVELSEEQEIWLEWLVANEIEHVRLEEA